MNNFLHIEIEDAKKNLIALANYIKDSFCLCHQGFIELNQNFAKQVIKRDGYVNNEEIKIEEQIIRYISLYQPVARDVRLAITLLKINHDLERIHDSFTNICQTIIALNLENKSDISSGFNKLFKFLTKMLDKTLKAFSENDSQLALEICQEVAELKKIKNNIFMSIERRLQKSNDTDPLLHLSFTLKNIYRIGKYLINISEGIYFIKKGEIIRHNHTLI